MNLAFRNEIAITVLLSGGAIADVKVEPRSRPPLTRLFAGKPAASLLPVLPRLFSLCSVAHQVAYLSAVEAARGDDAAPMTMRRRITAVIAERLTELLRSLFIGRLALDGARAASVRAMMQAGAVLCAGADESGPETPRREAVLQIKSALGELGIAGEDPAPGSMIAAYLAGLDAEALTSPLAEPSFLTAADDLDIVTRLSRDGADFSDAPDLHGRIPETGVWARRIGRQPVPPPGAGPAERFKARIAEVARLCAWLEGSGQDHDDSAVAAYRLGSGKGAAAVECARGRLHHAVELDRDDRIVRFEFLAPTEWNFHGRGPLVRSLKGAVLASGRRGQDAVRALVDSFDPCVGFSLSYREAGHA
ncbi:nickel-dependent hydrogenase large subunit [Bradyrhizobium iriomotense]|uniref:nickel-dependent hydrogenase large subunit n=1 Tax=Bradyrhizobium iriomotense TaxID=441950 RepID=UPI001B8A4A53|nr:nickel-dependent hydrogenase large subunit [Bradyrhizobium iriomotense]MBR0781036.1 nickel-dependent hydrogenase large subunit [Bradyrhizobium iriomotense]